MKILALDSTENTASVAITEDDKLIASSVINAGRSHSELLLPLIQNLLEYNKLKASDIDLFACSVGPGSFTGVRIGVSTVKGLAFGLNKACVGISTLEGLAYNYIGFNGIICPCMDARRSQLYNAIFRIQNGVITRLTPDRTIPASELSNELENYNESIYFCGGGEHIIAELCKNNVSVQKTPEILKHQNGYSVALCAYNIYKNEPEKILSDAELNVTYLRPSQAERMKNGEKD